MNRFEIFSKKSIFGSSWAILAKISKFGPNRIFPEKTALSLFYVHGPITSRKRQKINDVNAMQWLQVYVIIII